MQNVRFHGRQTLVSLAISIIFFGMAIAFQPGAASELARSGPKHVLVLFENNRLLPANIQGDKGFNDAIATAGPEAVISEEFLDAPRFDGEAYVRIVLNFLKDKYANQPPDIVVVAGSGALDFLLKHRADLFPTVPVVHMGVDKSFVDGLTRPLPPDVIGIPIEYDFAGTIDQALKWAPRAKRLLLVTGTSAPDREWEAQLRRMEGQFRGRVLVEHLAGLSTAAVLQRLARLDDSTVVFTPGYFQDGAGQAFKPRQAAQLMATASTAPVYGPFDTFMGTGVVGGRMPSFEAAGHEAGRIAVQLIDGADPASLKLPQVMPTVLNLDWRQAVRWHIDRREIPPGTVVMFKAPDFLEAYRTEVIVALAAFLLQTGLVAGLLVERRRRRTAEVAVDKHRFELAHASRMAVAGELTASIAHEINQPLGAILSNVNAAELLMDAGGDHAKEIREILRDVHRDNLRASAVIQQLRELLAKHTVEKSIIDLNQSLGDMATILRREAARRDVVLIVRPSPVAVPVLADTTQMQQILINLVLNGMDAVAGEAGERRMVSVSVERHGKIAAIEVQDRGHGITPETLPRLFDSFFSTKRTGIGLGLSIVKTLVENKGGTIWAENSAAGGATFHVELPIAENPVPVRLA